MFHEVPRVDVQTIEERLKYMNLHVVQKKGMHFLNNNVTRIIQFNTKKEKQNYPR